LTEISGGTILAGKPSDGLYGWEGKGFNRLAAGDSSQADPQINALLTVRDGSCWVAAGHGLLHFKNPQSMSNETGVVALAGLNVISLSEDNGGGIWAGTRNGELWHLQSGAWVAKSNLWQPHAITTMAQGAAGMWVGTEGGGLFELQSDTIRTRLGKGSGLLSDLIRTLYMDGQGTLWIGTAGGGLTRWNNGAIATFTTREGLPDDTVSQILEDDAGRLWLGGNRGICCVGKHELGELMARNIPGVYPQIYGRADGMLSEECTGGFCPAGLKSKSGLLWFSTLKGVVVADPRPGNSGEPPPTVFLEEVLIDGITKHELRMNSRLGEKGGLPGSGGDGLIIPPGKHRLEFRYTGLSFGAPERVRFRYRLEPLDSDWVDAAERGTRRTASYSYVPPGDYRFRVIACNADGVWNDTGAGMELTVSSHFWQAWWFIGLAGLALIGAVGGAARFVEKEKLQRRLKRLEQERALERERARIAQDLHDDLGSSLTRISLLSDLARADKHHPGQIEAHAKKISQSAAQTVRALEEIVWALRPGSDSLQSLIEYIAHVANETFEGDRARCRLDLPHNVPVRPLPPEMRHNIFLIVKEALTNALKHASAKEVRVQAKATEYSLAITVQDDGKGFDTAAAPGRTGRQGLGNMRRRAEAMNGRLEIRSAGGEGTTVALTVNFPAGRISGAT
jgi:signal transduction histidine kinase